MEDGNPKYDSRDNCNAIIETASNGVVWGYAATVLPKSVTRLKTNSYTAAVFSYLVIPNTITVIDSRALANCSSLKYVYIPASVKTIFGSTNDSGTAFYGCHSLTIYCEAESAPSGWGQYWNYNAVKSTYITTYYGVKNAMDSSLFTTNGLKNETGVSLWATGVLSNDSVKQVFKPSTSYLLSFEVECESVPEHSSNASANLGFLLYTSVKTSSGADQSRYCMISSRYLVAGEKIIVSASFTTAETLYNAEENFRLLCYTQRYLDSSGAGVMSSMIFRNITLIEL